jgi:hypothetical protein
MSIGKATRDLIYAKDGYKCVFCKTTQNLTIDHKIPLSKGGTSQYENLQTLCRRCNGSKGNSLNYDPTMQSIKRVVFKVSRREKKKINAIATLPKHIPPDWNAKPNYEQWIADLQRTYFAAYKSVPEPMWRWIFDNLIKKEL